MYKESGIQIWYWDKDVFLTLLLFYREGMDKRFSVYFKL